MNLPKVQEYGLMFVSRREIVVQNPKLLHSLQIKCPLKNPFSFPLVFSASYLTCRKSSNFNEILKVCHIDHRCRESPQSTRIWPNVCFPKGNCGSKPPTCYILFKSNVLLEML